MNWNLNDAMEYYKSLGAPRDQNVLISLLKEVQSENGGILPAYSLSSIAGFYGISENLLRALIRRVSSLRIGNTHCLEICSGRNCGKHTALADYAQSLQKKYPEQISLRFCPCMRLCGKGPNIKWDGTLYHHADQALLDSFIRQL